LYHREVAGIFEKSVMKNIFLLSVLLMLVYAGSGCYYDKEAVLYPQGVCDTSVVRWSTTIRPIIDAQCSYVGCHEGSNAPSGVVLTSYDGVHAIALDGSLLGTIEHQPNYTPMPRSSTQLPECQISQIRIWVAEGAPNN
jgi:hypothetical protein